MPRGMDISEVWFEQSLIQLGNMVTTSKERELVLRLVYA